MGKFTRIPEDTFQALQLDAGVLLRTFNPASPAQDITEDIICATTGGINVVCKPTFSDLGEDVDNVPVNMKELKHLDSWECTVSTTSLGTSPELIKMALGCADIDGTDASKIVPRADLRQTDFSSIWWVGDKADGGMVAVCIKNALSTEGFSLQTTKNGKGQIAITITGHVSINAQDEVPMEFYSVDGSSGFIALDKTRTTVAVSGTTTLTATTNPANAVVTWSSLDSDDASVAASGASPYHSGTVTGVSAGTATIQAAITVDGVTYKAKCLVDVTAT